MVRGHKHDYLGMNLDFLEKGAVRIDMIPYIKKINDAFPEKIMGVQSTPAGDRLFQVQPPDETKYLPEEQARAFHYTTAQLLFLSRVRRDIQTTVAFLTTRLKILTTMTGASSSGFLSIYIPHAPYASLFLPTLFPI